MSRVRATFGAAIGAGLRRGGAAQSRKEKVEALPEKVLAREEEEGENYASRSDIEVQKSHPLPYRSDSHPLHK